MLWENLMHGRPDKIQSRVKLFSHRLYVCDVLSTSCFDLLISSFCIKLLAYTDIATWKSQ